MSVNKTIMNRPQDHIMANTWRLIFEQRRHSERPNSLPVPDFSALEQMLPEYRLIGEFLADKKSRRHLD